MSKFLLVLLSISILFIEAKTFKTTKVATSKSVEVINGYTLPPEPDEKINNSTLLGVDSNKNGIRDDVERWIIKKYKDHHKIVTEIGFQKARAYQQILKNPLNTEENHKALMDSLDCNIYFEEVADQFGDSILIDHTIEFRKLQSPILKISAIFSKVS